MKNVLNFLLITGLFLSCKSNTKHAVKDSTSTVNPTTDESSAIIQKFKPIIQGVWVEKDYIEKVIKTRSPLAATDEIKGNTTLNINTNEIKGDSLIVTAGDNHEGTQFTLKFHPGKVPSTIKISEGGELGYSIEKGDTILLLSSFDSEQKKTITTKFIKALNKQPKGDLGDGLNYLVNKGLIAGNYTLTDSAGVISKVRFSNSGEVSGFTGFTQYSIDIDLNNDPMDNLDEITFNLYKKNAKNYSFKINADTLSLYNTRANSDSTELILDKLAYKLVRQK